MSSWFAKRKNAASGAVQQDKRSTPSFSPWTPPSSSTGSSARIPVNSVSSPAGNFVKPAASSSYVSSQTLECRWNDVRVLLNRCSTLVTEDEWNLVLAFTEELVSALASDDQSVQKKLVDIIFSLDVHVLDQLVTLTVQSSTYGSEAKLYQLQLRLLRLFDLILGSPHLLTLTDKHVIQPLVRLLSACSCTATGPDIEKHVVLVLHQLCIGITQNPSVLELLFCSSAEDSCSGIANGGDSNRFIVFSLLVPYVHQEGSSAQQARDDLLLIMSLLSSHDDISQHIVDRSDFCPLLATGLSGLYSAMPRQIEYPSDDWNQISAEDIAAYPAISIFLNSLEFCNAVVQVAHPFVRDRLQKYVYDGFLISVLGPALHQDSLKLPPSLRNSWLATSMEEVIATTAYLELFVRKITDPGLLKTFVNFILVGKVDDIDVVESLVSRIASSPRLCMVTLTLFKTLIELNSEEIMFHLIFRYLIPCTHVMVSQQKCVRDPDMYNYSAEKLISLTPVCTRCLMHHSSQDSSSTSEETDNLSSSTNTSSYEGVLSSPNPTSVQTRAVKWFLSRRSRMSQSVDSQSLRGSLPGSPSNSHQDVVYESSYIEYLHGARIAIEQCAKVCRNWSAPYDGENPPPPRLLSPVDISPADGVLNEGSHIQDAVRSYEAETEEEPLTRIIKNSNSHNVMAKSVPSIAVSHEQDVTDGTVQELESSNLALLESRDGRNCEITANCETPLFYAILPNPSSAEPSPSGSADDLEMFLKQLSHVPSRNDDIPDGADILSEFDAIVDQLAASPQQVEPETNGSAAVVFDAAMSEPLPNDATVSVPVDMAGSDWQPCSSGVVCATDEQAVSRSQDIGSDEADGVASTHRCSQKNDSIGQDLSNPCPSLLDYRLVSASQSPTIGPFLTSLLNKLEMMMQNPLYVNLQLTGLLTRLACYPQPLLKSILLSHSLVFQPSIKSLIQVLTVVKHRLDNYLITVDDYEGLLIQASQYLMWRDEASRDASDGSTRKDSILSLPSNLHQQSPQISEKRKMRSLADLFNKSPLRPTEHLTFDRRRVLFVNHPSPSSSPAKAEMSLEVRTKNAIYCAIVFREFVKELAAVSQEHMIIQADSATAVRAAHG